MYLDKKLFWNYLKYYASNGLCKNLLLVFFLDTSANKK